MRRLMFAGLLALTAPFAAAAPAAAQPYQAPAPGYGGYEDGRRRAPLAGCAGAL